VKRIKLIFLTGSLEIGGTERNILHLASSLDRSQYDIEVWCNYEGQPLQKEIERLRIPCKALKAPSAGRRWFVRLFCHNLPYQWRLWRMLRQARPDVVHIFGFPMAYYGVLLGRLAGARRMLFTVQDWDVWKKSAVYRWLDRVCSRLATVIIADGVGARSLAVRSQGMPARKVRVIYDGVNVQELTAAMPREGVLREIGLDPSRPVAAVIARLDMRKKGQDVLLEAIPAVASAVPHLQFLLVGGGPDEEELRRRAAQLPLRQRPKFAGFRTDLANVLNAIDILVIPSRWESVPKILLEGMWLRKAVVATRVGDIEEILDASCGALVAADSVQDIAHALIQLGKDGERRQRLGEAAHERIERMGLTLDRSIRQYDRLYHELARGQERSPTGFGAA